jgi:NhaA family Na+:H+ antiporter
MSNAPQLKAALFRRGSWWEARRIAEVLRQETIGGALLLAAAVAALAWANSPWSAAYESLRTLTVGPSAWHLHLDLATWAADGLLAIFFFVAGLELKREFAAGDLRDPRRAAVPVAAAVGGVIVPALIYTAFTAGAGGGALRGWAIPGATDIAFALAVLAVAGRHLPTALRTFLLTLAVVDDLLAIVIIAVFYTSGLSVLPLATALVPLAVFAVLVRRRPGSWWLLLPLAAATWVLVHASGVHATVAGVLLAFTVPVLRSAERGGRGTGRGLAGHFEHRLRPVSAGLAVPVFALLSAGVSLGGLSGLRTALADPVALGVVAGLVAGKAIGIITATWLVARFTRATLDEGLSWTDVAGVAMLGGVGFTVSLLIGELAFGPGGGREDHAKVAVLTGSLIAALLATTVLRLRNRVYRRIEAAESLDADHDGIPDVYEADLDHREAAGSQITRSPGTTPRAVAGAEQARCTPHPRRQPSGSNGSRGLANARTLIEHAGGCPAPSALHGEGIRAAHDALHRTSPGSRPITRRCSHQGIVRGGGQLWRERQWSAALPGWRTPRRLPSRSWSRSAQPNPGGRRSCSRPGTPSGWRWTAWRRTSPATAVLPCVTCSRGMRKRAGGTWPGRASSPTAWDGTYRTMPICIPQRARVPA